MQLIVALAVVSVLSGQQVRAQDSPFGIEYRGLVEAYRTGQAETSVARLLDLKHDAVLALVNRYVKLGERGFAGDATLDDDFFRAASMLHADAAFRGWEQWRDDEAWAHLNVARRLVDVGERPNTTLGSFRRRWYAATAVVATGHLTPQDALEYFEDAVEKMPDDVPVLTAAGWFSERLSHRAAARGASLRRLREIRRVHQRTAVRYLTAALKRDPNAGEAALRLARVEASLEHDAQARTRLTALLARDDLQPLIAYVGRLILGQLQERRGDLREAERLYREAMTMDPIAQSARVALARLLYASGDSPGAADVIEPAVRSGTEPDRNDPWSDYQLAYPAIGRVLLDDLRDEVQR
jgi:tetratricopeptide (TPR) repeat protein